MSIRTNVYVDGFNLYYRCLKDTQYKWLNILELCVRSFPQNQICRTRYFTAKVSATKTDPQKPQRQELYLRALGTIPNLSIHYGRFSSHVRSMPLAQPPAHGSHMVDVIYTEEKGSDVNLASFLLRDAFRHDFEAAIVVSNDSDLVEPIRMVRYELHLPVGILNPQRSSTQVPRDLRNVASFYRHITQSALATCQFPGSLSDSQGTFHKPLSW